MHWHRTQPNIFGPMKQARSLLGLVIVMAIILIMVYVLTSGERDPVIGYAKGLSLSEFGIAGSSYISRTIAATARNVKLSAWNRMSSII